MGAKTPKALLLARYLIEPRNVPYDIILNLEESTT